MKDNKNQLDFSMVLASSVHDMKNSVGVLLASVETLLDEHKESLGAKNPHFRTLHYEASRINGELVQLLSIYRMDNGFMHVAIDEHYLIDVLEEQVARNQPLLDTAHVELTISCDESLHWYFDADLIGSVIHNVLVNCIRYTDTHIHLSAFVDNDMLCIELADNGDGYPEDMLQDPTKRILDAEMSKGATHLGLFFAKNIAELHEQQGKKGRINLSNGGRLQGGVFNIYLP